MPKHLFKKGHKGYFPKGYVAWNKGKKLSTEHIKKLSESHKGQIPINIKQIAGWFKGKKRPPFSKEWLSNMSKANKGKRPKNPFKKGHIPWNKGKKFLQISGENNPNWKGGKDKILLARSQIEYFIWRKMVFERDNYTCQKCKDNKGHNLNAHHIENFSTNIEKRYAVSNGITLCNKCHNKFHLLYKTKNNNQKQLDEFLNEKDKIKN